MQHCERHTIIGEQLLSVIGELRGLPERNRSVTWDSDVPGLTTGQLLLPPCRHFSSSREEVAYSEKRVCIWNLYQLVSVLPDVVVEKLYDSGRLGSCLSWKTTLLGLMSPKIDGTVGPRFTCCNANWLTSCSS